MQLSRDLTNRLFQLAQSPAPTALSGFVSAEGGIANACFTLSADGDARQLLQEIHDQGLTPYATFAIAPDLHQPPTRPEALSLPSLPHLLIGSRIKGVLEIDAFIETPEGWSPIELRLPKV